MKEKIKSLFAKIKEIDYRPYVSIAITLCFLALGATVFYDFIPRFLESIFDFGNSCAYTFSEWFLEENRFTATVTELPTWHFDFSPTGNVSVPIPSTWDGFKVKWVQYWRTWASLETFLNYVLLVTLIVSTVYIIFALLLLFFYPFRRAFKKYIQKFNNDYDKKRVGVVVFERITDFTYRPIKKFIKGMYEYLKEHFIYVKIWLIMWGFYFNVFAIVFNFVAYLIYLLSTWDIVNLYRQVYKLFIDLTPALETVPFIVWLGVIVCFLECWARKIAYDRLESREYRNRCFVNERGVVTIVYGEMGAGKTKLITDMALTAEVKMRDDAFEILLECDLKFPNMNWAIFREELKKAIRKHKVFSVPTARKWLWAKYDSWQRKNCEKRIFGYNYKRYGLTYDDNLKVSNVWEVMDDYACAYLIYTVQSSLILANYSIRVDNLYEDLGNFPRWNTSFFRRDSRLMDSYSRHAHILDFDMLRLGKRLVKDNPNRYAFGFGVYVISEIDKERKNEKELRESNTKTNADECNQKNDLFNTLLKMSRHACVVANRVFIKIFADLQRPESLGADARELGQVTYIESSEEMQPLLPIWSPFYVLQFVFNKIFNKFVPAYNEYQFNRSDKSLPMYLYKNLMAKLKHVNDRICNLFNSSKVKLSVESGRMDGQSVLKPYFMQSKKIYSKRYATDCLNSIFDEYAEKNTIGLDDVPEYFGGLASDDELLMQHSFFQLEVRGYNREKVA